MQAPPKKTFSCKKVLLLMLATMFLTLAVVALVIKFWLYPQPFQPVQLQAKEQQGLIQKIEHLEHLSRNGAEGRLQGQSYTEQGLSREIIFTEREINSLLNPELAQKIAIAFDEDLVSLRLLIPLDPDFPIMGGKTLRLRAGAELAYRQNRPVLILKGVSLMGVPLPNAWLGGMKNVDLMKEFGNDFGFLQTVAEGLESIQLRRGELYIRLRE